MLSPLLSNVPTPEKEKRPIDLGLSSYWRFGKFTTVTTFILGFALFYLVFLGFILIFAPKQALIPATDLRIGFYIMLAAVVGAAAYEIFFRKQISTEEQKNSNNNQTRSKRKK